MGGFHHGSRDNDDSVLLAGGGYKSVSDFLQSQDHYKTSPGAGTAGTSSATSGSTLSVPYVTVNANGHVTAYGTHTHTISGFLTAQDHYKTSPGAGTAGTSSATSGSTLAVPYVTVNANGHVTGYGTHTHTVTGFLTSHQSVTNSNPNIKYGNTMTIGSVGGTNLQITLPNNEGTSDFTDNTELLTSYASNNGFADTNAPGVIYRRDALCMYNYIKGKLDSVYSAIHSHPYLPLAGGTMTGAINFTSTNARLAFGALTTSPITSYTAPALGSNGVGIQMKEQ